DEIGLELMARAGFDPRQSVELWKNMQKAGGSATPEFLSTHPGTDSRIRDLNARMDRAMKIYQQAQASGKRPNCRL
ncbi:MAG: M48 family metalloprotease, partial [Kangiella sp.]|nr:M48 family metalloprotease [Kangiella sp.]